MRHRLRINPKIPPASDRVIAYRVQLRPLLACRAPHPRLTVLDRCFQPKSLDQPCRLDHPNPRTAALDGHRGRMSDQVGDVAHFRNVARTFSESLAGERWEPRPIPQPELHPSL
jgi:hypothetical protein